TLTAYRQDMQSYMDWLRTQGVDDPLQARAEHVHGWFAERHASQRASTANRKQATLRRFYQWSLREGRIQENPCLHLASAKPIPRLPKTLSQDQVEDLLQAPDVREPLGLRDRAML